MSVPTKERIFGLRVKELRLERKLRQTDLAEKAGISWRHLLRIEKGEGGVTKMSTVARLAEALAVDPSELNGGSDDEDEEADIAMHEAFALFVDLMGRLQDRKPVREESPA